MRLRTPALALAGTLFGPAAASLDPLRRVLTPRVLPPALSGIGGSEHVALTFDDGPDPHSTPRFLELLERHGTHATFFLLGRWVARHPSLVREMAEAGHELAVHGWDHRAVAFKAPGVLHEELARTRGVVGDLTGHRARWYRPPYGVVSTESLLTARSLGLTTVLWSAWGRDWERRATPGSIVGTVTRRLHPGGTVLLHDTDRTSAPGSWHHTLAATDSLLVSWRAAGTAVGPLAEHGLEPRRPAGAGRGPEEWRSRLSESNRRPIHYE